MESHLMDALWAVANEESEKKKPITIEPRDKFRDYFQKVPASFEMEWQRRLNRHHLTDHIVILYRSEVYDSSQ